MAKEEVFPSPTIKGQIQFINICLYLINRGKNKSTKRI